MRHSSGYASWALSIYNVGRGRRWGENPFALTSPLEYAKIPDLHSNVDIRQRDHFCEPSRLPQVSFLKGIKTHPNLISYRDSFLAETRLVIVAPSAASRRRVAVFRS